jgi:uncharacterized protein with NAD-binding domain and iron-sulfur cluster
MAQKVVVLGSGVAGLSAAHELIERGFDVEVYEAWLPSGKTRRIPVPGNATLRSNGMCNDLLGEHGFRFFRLRYSFGQATAPRVSYGWISFP